MRVLIASDLHHEHWRDSALAIDPAISRPDVVVLAGDINDGDAAVTWSARNFTGLPVLYVRGNHEAYGHNFDDNRDAIVAACSRADNVHFLDRGEFIAGSVRFLGATLRTDFDLFGADRREEAMRQAEIVLADYKRIGMVDGGGRPSRAADTAQFHRIEKDWLAGKLAEPFAGITVVNTHLSPSLRSVAERDATDIVSASCASVLDGLVAQADLWIHGHMHDSSDYTIGRCRVVCNPCGYYLANGAPENARFDPHFVVELE